MRTLEFLIVVALGLSDWPARAQTSPLEPVFGNTIVITDAEGFETDVFVERNGFFTGVLPDGSKFSGTWRLDGVDVCFAEAMPYARPPLCWPYGSRTSVTKWRGKDSNGESFTVSIMGGRRPRR